MALPQDFIHRLKAASPIDQVIGGYVPLKRAGALLKCCCPFHSERTPSFTVYANTQDQHFYCFGCHEGGDVITFIMRMENLTYIEAVQFLAERAGLTLPDERAGGGGVPDMRRRILELNRAAAKFYYRQLTGPDKRGLAYLKNRALSPETVRRFGLGYAGDSWDALCTAMRQEGFTEQELLAANLAVRNDKNGLLRDRFHSRVMFPIFDLRGSIIAFGGRTLEPDGKPKYLNSSDTPVFNKRVNLFGLNLAVKSQSKRLILAEGYMDVIAIFQGGFQNTAASLGTSLTVEQCRLLQQHKFEEVVIAYDADRAGQDAAMRALRPMREVGLRVYRLQLHDAKDPDEFIKKFGALEFRRLLENAPDAVEFALQQSSADIPDPDSDSGAVEALTRRIRILAELDSDLERDRRISRVAEEFRVNRQILTEQVERMRKKQQRTGRKQEWESIRSAPALPDPLVPDAHGKGKQITAEEMLFAYLYQCPDEAAFLRSRIPPEQFVTDFHRRIYAHLLEKIEAGETPNLSLFSEAFSPEQTGRITGIIRRYADERISRETAETLAETVAERKPTREEITEASDDQYRALFEDIQRRHLPRKSPNES